MPPRRLIPALAAVSLLTLAAPAPSALADDLPVIPLAVQDGHFHPDVVHVPANRKFKLKVTNHGPGVEEFESSDLNREQIVPPGGSIQVFLGPLKPGRDHFFGDFHPATAQGEMVAR